MLGHRSKPGPPVRLTHSVVDSETATELRFASRCGLNYLTVPKTTAGVKSSFVLRSRVRESAESQSSTARDQLPGLQHPTGFHGVYMQHADRNFNDEEVNV